MNESNDNMENSLPHTANNFQFTQSIHTTSFTLSPSESERERFTGNTPSNIVLKHEMGNRKSLGSLLIRYGFKHCPPFRHVFYLHGVVVYFLKSHQVVPCEHVGKAYRYCSDCKKWIGYLYYEAHKHTWKHKDNKKIRKKFVKKKVEYCMDVEITMDDIVFVESTEKKDILGKSYIA